MIKKYYYFLLLMLLTHTGCQTSIDRNVASLGPVSSYKSENLKPIGDFGILFDLDRNIFLDGNSREFGTCRRDDPPAWASQLEEYFSILGKQKTNGFSYFQKFHIIKLKRGDASAVQINQNSDGVVTLIINYVKKQIFPNGIQADFKLAEMKCENHLKDSVLKENIYLWPDGYDLITALNAAPSRPENKSFSNVEFIKYMASKKVLVQIDMDNLEKNHQSLWALNQPLKLWGDEVSKDGQNLKSIDYWIKTISQKSGAAKQFQFLKVNVSAESKFGIEVDQLANRFSSRTNYQYDPTRLFISTDIKGGNFKIPHLNDLNQCLDQLKGDFLRQVAAESHENAYSNRPESFLIPGYSCQYPLKSAR